MSANAVVCLREIKSQSLAELFTSIQQDFSPLGSTQIPALDASYTCRRGDVIELQGPTASGKTHFLYYMLINCILPPISSSFRLHGWGKAAIVLDADHKFDIQRFNQLLLSHVKCRLPLESSAAQDIVSKSLDRLHIFRPNTLYQMAATVHYLPAYLTTNLPDSDLGILAVDSLSAFYWPDRYLVERFRAGPSRNNLKSLQNPLNYFLASLQTFRKSHGPLVLLSTWDLNPPQPNKSDFDQSSAVPPPAHTGIDKLSFIPPRPMPITHLISFIPPTLLHFEDQDNVSRRNQRFQVLGNVTRLTGRLRGLEDPGSSILDLYVDDNNVFTQDPHL